MILRNLKLKIKFNKIKVHSVHCNNPWDLGNRLDFIQVKWLWVVDCYSAGIRLTYIISTQSLDQYLQIFMIMQYLLLLKKRHNNQWQKQNIEKSSTHNSTKAFATAADSNWYNKFQKVDKKFCNRPRWVAQCVCCWKN